MSSQLCPRHTLDSDGPRCPQRPSPKLQKAGCVAVDGAAQLVQCVVERDVGKFLRGKGRLAWSAGRKVSTQGSPPCVHLVHTSVTTLRTPWIRLEVWKRPGLVVTASRTRPTKSRSWMGSAHMGPPSCEHTGYRRARGINARALGPWARCLSLTWAHLVSLSTVFTLRGHWRTTGCRELGPVRRGSLRRSCWKRGDLGHPSNPKHLCSPATRVSRRFAKALQVEGSTTHTLEHQGLLAIETQERP